TVWRNVGIIAAERGGDVVVVEEVGVCRVDIDPAGAVGPYLAPGVRRELARGVDVAADVPRRDAEPAASTQEKVRIVLAHPSAQREGIADGCTRGRHLFLVLQPALNGVDHGLNDRKKRARRGRQAYDKRVERGGAVHERAWLQELHRLGAC